jgi:hypothetical protein
MQRLRGPFRSPPELWWVCAELSEAGEVEPAAVSTSLPQYEMAS